MRTLLTCWWKSDNPGYQLAKHLPSNQQGVFKSVPKFDEPNKVYVQGEPKKQLFQYNEITPLKKWWNNPSYPNLFAAIYRVYNSIYNW